MVDDSPGDPAADGVDIDPVDLDAEPDEIGPTVVLVVCHGNVCRSPLAAVLLQEQLTADGLDVEVRSRGTEALVDEPVDAETLAIGRSLGVDLGDHRAVQLQAHDVEAAALVLTSTREQRGTVASLAPRALRRAFTLRQLSRLVGDAERDQEMMDRADDAAGRVEALVEVARRERGRHFVVTPEDDDVVDPYGQSREMHETAAQQIVPAVDRIAAVLRLPDAVSETEAV